MPLKPGKSNLKANFHELRHGKTYARTRKKFGQARAQKQMEAIALHEAGESKSERKSGRKHGGKR